MRVFDIENVMHCNEHKGKRKEDEGQILRSCSQTQFYFLSKKLLLFSDYNAQLKVGEGGWG